MCTVCSLHHPRGIITLPSTRQGDTWHYHLAINEAPTERVAAVELCHVPRKRRAEERPPSRRVVGKDLRTFIEMPSWKLIESMPS